MKLGNLYQPLNLETGPLGRQVTKVYALVDRFVFVSLYSGSKIDMSSSKIIAARTKKIVREAD
jgi:hypothetical protein